jgi:cell division septal protein FtsQ
MAPKKGSRRSAAKPTTRTIRGSRSAGSRSNRKNVASGKNLLPVFLSLCIVFCIGVFIYLGYRAVTASDFFGVAAVEVAGTGRASKENIERMVLAETERSGVWNADLPEIRAKIEKLPFVRSAAVTRVLPNGVRVEIYEHEPKAIVKMPGGLMLVDQDAKILAKTDGPEEHLPFAVIGWDAEKSENADRENIERVKLYQKMLADWKTYGIETRVQDLDLSNLRDPRAVVEDSGTNVLIAVGRENYGENLSKGIKAIAGKGQTFAAVDLVGSNMILSPRKVQEK